MKIIYQLNSYVKSFNANASIAGLIRNEIAKIKKSDFFPEDYFFVTHLTNPMNAFLLRKYPQIETPPEIARKLLLGKQLEFLAGSWFRNLPYFSVSEGKLDGIFVGIKGVRGSFDYRIGDSIIEFKTKDELPETKEDIFREYPQDIEQLAFYSVLHPEKLHENYLVFMTNVRPYKIKAYKVKTVNPNDIANLLKSRIKLLSEAIKTNDQSKIGKCRYYSKGCKFKSNSLCNCDSSLEFQLDTLKRSLYVELDEGLTKKLKEQIELSTLPESCFTTKDIIAPRKYYMENVYSIQEEWGRSSEYGGYMACMGSLIRRISIKLKSVEREYLSKSLKIQDLRIAQRWVKLPTSSGKLGEEILPYILKVSNATNRDRIGIPSQYYLAELGIICSSYGRNKGLIFVVYPNLENEIQVFEIFFDRMNEMKNFVEDKINALKHSCSNKRLQDLEPCPTFMNNDETCPLMENCHQEGIEGCRR